MSRKAMSTINSVEGDEAANSTTPPKNRTPWSARPALSDPQLRDHFDRIMDHRIMVFVENGEKRDALAALATLRADLRELHQLLIVKEDEQKAGDNDPSKERATAPASRDDLIALQRQIEQLCDASKQDTTPPAATENDLRAEVASLKKAVAQLSTTVKDDKEAHRVALERLKLWSKLFCERFPAFVDEVWDATKEPRTQRSTSPQAGDSSSDDDDDKKWLRARLRARLLELGKLRSKMSAMRAGQPVVYVAKSL